MELNDLLRRQNIDPSIVLEVTLPEGIVQEALADLDDGSTVRADASVSRS
jgi:hypothetical protein